MLTRNTGAKLGIYNSTVTEQFEKKYAKPQENGNHTGVRWTALTAEDGTGILVSSDSEMESGHCTTKQKIWHLTVIHIRYLYRKIQS